MYSAGFNRLIDFFKTLKNLELDNLSEIKYLNNNIVRSLTG